MIFGAGRQRDPRRRDQEILPQRILNAQRRDGRSAWQKMMVTATAAGWAPN